MNKIASTKKTSAIFLATVLVTGIIAAISPSFIIGVNAQAEPYYGSDNRYNDYKPDYGMDIYKKPEIFPDIYKKPEIFPANKVAELGDRWWQWILSLNVETNPNPFTEVGQAGCDVGLQEGGKLLFLVGSPSDPPLSGLFPVHECKIKEGTSILFPIVNVFCAENEVPPLPTEAERRICANEAQDTAFDLQLEIDGIEINTNLERKYRVDSPPGGFEFNAVAGNHFYPILGPSTGYSDGVWILLKHLKPGEHTITFSGKLDLTDITGEVVDAGATYNLDVIPKYY